MNFDKIIAVRNNKKVYKDGSRCIKVFNSNYPKTDVLNEALNQAKIEETGLNVPKLLEVGVFDGNWTIISEYIQGETLAELMEKDPERKDEYIALLVELQLTVHEKTCPVLTTLKDSLNRKIYLSDLDATTRFDLHAKLENMPRHTKVCHGDFCPSNIVIDESGTPYILDWSHTTQGNASADAAKTYILFLLDGDVDGAEKYLDLFCLKSDTPRENVERWFPCVAAANYIKATDEQREFLLTLIK